jgi:hypothetical protein
MKENKIYQKIQREKLYNLQYKAYVDCVLFFRNKQYSELPILDAAIGSSGNFDFIFKIKRDTIKIKLLFANCRTFHAASCDMFCFGLTEAVKQVKDGIRKRKRILLLWKKMVFTTSKFDCSEVDRLFNTVNATAKLVVLCKL